MSPQFQVAQIDHVELFVPDRRTAAAWYERTLGLTIIPEFEFWAESDGGPLMIDTAEGGTKLALFAGEPRGNRESAGLHRVAFRVEGEGFLAFLEHIKRNHIHDNHGHEIDTLSCIDHDQSWSVYFCDPYGSRLEVTTYDYGYVAERLGGR